MTQSQEKLNIIVLGYSGVGRTSILNRGLDIESSQFSVSTIGLDTKSKFFKFDDTKIKVNYFFSNGQERFKDVSSKFLKKADGAIFVFDITKKATFELIGKWLDDIRENNKLDIPKILIGNKVDLETERKVSKEEGEQLAKLLKCKYYETSAKTGQNVKQALDEITEFTYSIWKNSEKKHSIKISSDNSGKKKLSAKNKGCQD